MTEPSQRAGARDALSAPAVVGRELEYQRLYLPPGTNRRTAQTVLTMHAEFGDWELDRLRLLPDGSRRVLLRRRRRRTPLPSYLPT